MKWIFADWADNKGHVFESVGRAMTALGHEIASIPRSVFSRREELLSAILSRQFDALLTWQRFYPMQTDIRMAVATSGIRTLFMDFGFVPHYQSVVFDSRGENAASTWPEMWTRGGIRGVTEDHMSAAGALMREHAGTARMLEVPAELSASGLRFPFLFVPLQRPKDSVVRYDSSVHDFGSLLRRVLFLARGRWFVVCKTHPLDRDLDLGVPDKIDGSHIILRQSFGASNENVCDYLLSRASLVVGVNSNMLFRAVVYGTPVLAAGRGWYSGSNAVHEVKGLESLHELNVDPVNARDQQVFIAACLSRQLRFAELADPEKISGILRRVWDQETMTAAST